MEAQLQSDGSNPLRESVGTLLHELSVSQQELEVQNEELRETQLALEESRDLFAQLFELAPVPYLRVDMGGLIQVCNRAAAKLFGCDPMELRGRPLSSRFPSETVPLLIEQRKRALAAREAITVEVPLAGYERFALATASTFTRGQVFGFLYSLLEITQQKNAELRLSALTEQLEATNVRLHELAMRDPLTGAYNRRGFEHELSRELGRARRSGEPLCAVMADCDNFKRINDSLGHAAGDVVLRTVAQRLQDGLRPTDVFARIGGDEFMVLLPGAGLAQSTHIAERLRLSVANEPVALSHGPIPLSVSLAVAQVDDQTGAIEELLAACRGPLRSSKQNGKNRTTTEQRPGRAPLVDTLLDGWNTDGFFSTVAQAIVALSDGHIRGLELLCRGPLGRYHLPDDIFRAAAEQSLLTPVDVRCLRACLSAARELDRGQWCHVNVYPSTLLDLREEGLLELIRPHERSAPVCLELSEQQMLGDVSAVADVLAGIRPRGVRLAIDDVGFGRSSLESLLSLEPEIIKIDRRLVSGVGVAAERRRTLARVLSVARALGSEVIAEGVECLEDVAVLRDLGVCYAQGFLWGRPGALPLGNVAPQAACVQMYPL